MNCMYTVCSAAAQASLGTYEVTPHRPSVRHRTAPVCFCLSMTATHMLYNEPVIRKRKRPPPIWQRNTSVKQPPQETALLEHRAYPVSWNQSPTCNICLIYRPASWHLAPKKHRSPLSVTVIRADWYQHLMHRNK